jgi:hypothetical protein
VVKSTGRGLYVWQRVWRYADWSFSIPVLAGPHEVRFVDITVHSDGRRARQELEAATPGTEKRNAGQLKVKPQDQSMRKPFSVCWGMVRSTAGYTDCNMQQTADSRQQTADSRQQTADSRQQTADSRQQTADSRQQARRQQARRQQQRSSLTSAVR